MSSAKRRFEERKARRERAIKIAVVIFVVAGAGIAYFVLDPLGSSSADDGDFEGGARALIYADFDEAKDLHRLDLDSRQDSIVAQLPKSGNTLASFGSRWLTIEVPERDGGSVMPVVYLADPEQDSVVRLGTRLEPMFSPDGQRLAVLRPIDESRCGESSCAGDKVVTVLDVEDPQAENELSEPGRFTLRDWAGGHLVVIDGSTQGPSVLRSISPTGAITALPILPKDYWGASPDGAYVIESTFDVTRFHTFSDGKVVDAGAEIGIPDGTVLGSGAWSPDSRRVAAFALDDDDALVLVTFGLEDPEPRTLAEGGESLSGDVLWSPDNDALAFTRFNGTELEVVYCLLDDPDSCEVLLTWTRGISPLRLE